MHLISPETVFRGINAWSEALPRITKLTKRPLILGRSKKTIYLRKKIYEDLKQRKLDVVTANLEFDCCKEDLSRVK